MICNDGFPINIDYLVSEWISNANVIVIAVFNCCREILELNEPEFTQDQLTMLKK